MSPGQEEQVCDALVNLGPLETEQGLHAEGVRAAQGGLRCSVDDARAALHDLRQFYAHFYAGLSFEATGNRERARVEITTAADRYTVGGYMHDVAVVHRDTLLRSK